MNSKSSSKTGFPEVFNLSRVSHRQDLRSGNRLDLEHFDGQLESGMCEIIAIAKSASSVSPLQLLLIFFYLLQTLTGSVSNESFNVDPVVPTSVSMDADKNACRSCTANEMYIK